LGDAIAHKADAVAYKMIRQSAFSYACGQCGRCCHGQAITLSPYDLIRIARAAGIGTAEARARYTIRRGSILKFTPAGGCSALDGTQCGIHRGRPLACRLYPLGLERGAGGVEKFVTLEPAAGSLGVYGERGSVREFLDEQEADGYIAMNSRYESVVALMRERIGALADFEATEPREFWRVAVREALAESGFDSNCLIDAMFDADGAGCAGDTDAATVDMHVDELKRRIRAENDPIVLAAAAVMLAVSLGYSPGDVTGPP
jgi:hypothetical protein